MCSSFDTFENYIHITISFNTLALFLRQERESAERTHEEQMASTKQSAQERERDRSGRAAGTNRGETTAERSVPSPTAVAPCFELTLSQATNTVCFVTTSLPPTASARHKTRYNNYVINWLQVVPWAVITVNITIAGLSERKWTIVFSTVIVIVDSYYLACKLYYFSVHYKNVAQMYNLSIVHTCMTPHKARCPYSCFCFETFFTDQ